MAALAVVAAVMEPVTALGNWQYTRWGMTLVQVVAASHGTAWLTEDNGSYLRYMPNRDKALLLAKGQVAIDNLQFLVGFYFDTVTRRLVNVFLTLDPCSKTDAYEIKRLLAIKYGSPRATFYDLTAEWVSPLSPDIITFVASSCSISYKPVPAGL